MTAGAFLLGFLRDPVTQDGSSTRLAGLMLSFTACFVAAVGVWTRYSVAAEVAALVAGGAVPFLTRRSPPKKKQEQASEA